MPPYKLVIVESPAKCGKIAGFLGPNYKVIASMGHIRALDIDLDAVGIERDFEGKYIFIKEKAKAINQIKAAAAEASEVILAADDDREGEAIAYSIAVLLKLPLHTTKRAVFHEITKPAVVAAIADPRLIDMSRVHAQMARAQLDMMIGFTISPLLWKHVSKGLSAGRCQTPALRLVVDREEEIATFRGSSGWIVRGSWTTPDAAVIAATMTEELEDEESAANYMSMLVGQGATVVAVQPRPWSEGAPLPLITSSLQMAASSLFRSNPKNTMRVAQRLYEAGHITYMRTDKAVLGEEAVAEARALVEAKWGSDYVATTTTTNPKSRKAKPSGVDAPQAQEAHEAIRPTHFEVDGLAGDEWSALDRNIYRLIRLRALQSVMAAARGDQLTIRFHTADDPEGEFVSSGAAAAFTTTSLAERDAEFAWSATARRTTFQGWRAAGNTVHQEDAEPEIEVPAQWTALQSLKVGDELSWTDLAGEPHTTKPPNRYNEATLVKALEERGIGRPSTFASLLASIEEKGYVEKKNIEGRKMKVVKLAMDAGDTEPIRTITERTVGGERDRLVPTDIGNQALGFALANFGDLFSYDFTATMEARLDAISQATEPWKQILHDTWNLYKERYQTLNSSTSGSASAQIREFGSGLKAVLTRKGPMLLREGEPKATFYKWPAGVAFADLTAEMAAAAAAPPQEAAYTTTAAGAPIYKRSGKFGPYATDGTLNVPLVADDTPETIRAKFTAKAAVAATEKRVGPFTFRVGPHGPYMYKTDLKTKKFVSIPPSVDVDRLTIKVADDIYKLGLEAAAANPKGKWNKK